ncbi:MAG TPA: cell division ATP-binding protein FtsE [Thermoleophilaceae bacterium]
MESRDARPVRTDSERPNVPVIELREVTKVYDGGSIAVDRVSLQVGRGEFAFLVGPTGCGKSTLMRMLMKELEPSRGEILIAGRKLNDIPRKKVPQLRRNIGVIFQDFKLLPNRTVYQNVAYSLQVIGEGRQAIRKKVPEILRLVGLSTKLHSYPDQLSGGEQQRVSIARAFVNHPPLLLADEPTGNLDPETSIGIMQLIYRINRTGTTVLVATHDREMVDKMRRRVVELSEGRVIRDDESGLYRPDESTAEFAMNLREEMGYGKETVTRTKPERSRERAAEPVVDRAEVVSKARRFTEQDRDRYSEEKVRRALYGEDV